MKKLYEEIRKLNTFNNRTPSDRCLKAAEEFGEFAKEVNKITGMKKTSDTKEEIRENLIMECADTIQCLFSTLLECDKTIQFSEVLKYMEEKNKKWESVYAKSKK